jgi:hypothetical protein
VPGAAARAHPFLAALRLRRRPRLAGEAAMAFGGQVMLAHDLNRIPVPPRRPPAASWQPSSRYQQGPHPGPGGTTPQRRQNARYAVDMTVDHPHPRPGHIGGYARGYQGDLRGVGPFSADSATARWTVASRISIQWRARGKRPQLPPSVRLHRSFGLVVVMLTAGGPARTGVSAGAVRRAAGTSRPCAGPGTPRRRCQELFDHAVNASLPSP